MVAPTLFSSPLGQTVLVFVLVFVGIFAILQKSKVFGDGKKQIDALVAVAIAVLYFTPAWNYILDMIYGGEGSAIFMNIIFILVVVGAIAAVLSGSKSSSGGAK